MKNSHRRGSTPADPKSEAPLSKRDLLLREIDKIPEEYLNDVFEYLNILKNAIYGDRFLVKGGTKPAGDPSLLFNEEEQS